jgi:hypothetical protein
VVGPSSQDDDEDTDEEEGEREGGGRAQAVPFWSYGYDDSLFASSRFFSDFFLFCFVLF